MSLDDLEIFIITYNRCALLKKTLGVLLSEQSPVKNCSIICLDNNSDDDTERTVKNFDVPNLKYIKNNRNVGLMGNFAKCVEFCSKKYMWVLSDNDDIDFSAFNEVEKFMSNEAVLINVSSVIPKNNSKIETILAQSVFLPAMIYSTKYINDTVMSHIMCNIYTVFSDKHLFRWFLSTLNFRLKVKMMKCFLSQKLKNLIRKGK